MFERYKKVLSIETWRRKLSFRKSLLLKKYYQHYFLPQKVREIRQKRVIDVLFVLHELGSWKTEHLYLKMKEHARFAPKILLVRTDQAAYAYNILKDYLESKHYPYEALAKGECIKKKIHPDIIFYTKPYNGVINWRYFFDNNLYALFCYVAYSFRNRNMPNLKKYIFWDFIWQLYAENKKVIEESYNVFNNHGSNMVNTGIPIMDELVQDKSAYPDPWKPSLNKKRIIYAPHHTVFTESFPSTSPYDYSTFLDYCDFLIEMAQKYKEKVQWAFKPHPLLRSKLYQIWGKDRTDAYYDKWTELENCQIDEGEYMGLFKHSDAMIHDCGSFKLEYLYTGNPVLYLLKDNPVYDYENWQTKKALELHYKGRNEYDIEKFIQNVIDGQDSMKGEREDFVNKYLTPPYGRTASENIIHAILGEKEYA